MEKVNYDSVSITNYSLTEVNAEIDNLLSEIHNRIFTSNISKEERDFLLHNLQKLSEIASMNDHAQRSLLDSCGLDHSYIDDRETARKNAVYQDIDLYREISDNEKLFY